MLKTAQTHSAFDSLAARVETEVGAPATLLVTSAVDNDGTTMICARLAEAFTTVGYRVAVIDTHYTDDDTVNAKATTLSYGGVTVPSDASKTYSELALSDLGERFAGSRRDVAALVARLRTRYDYVIVDAPAFTRGSMPTLFADVCDALMIAVRKGRSATADDRRINAFLDGSTKHTLGIVSTSKAAINNYSATAEYRSRSVVPLHEIGEDRPARVSVVTGSI